MKVQRSIWMTALSLVLVAFVSCDVSDSDSGGNGTLSVKMHDSPASYDAINVEIEQVEVNADQGWKPVMDSSQTVNLLNLVNGTFAELGVIELDAGTYEQIRLILGSKNTITKDGQTYNLKVPSGQQTGLKINVDFSVENDATTELLLDFDAGRSVHKTGQGNPQFILRPVISGSVRALTGDIEGTVQPADSNPWILAMSGADTVSTTVADSASGDFELTGLPIDSYDVVVNPSDTTYADTTITGVQVNKDSTTDIGTIQLN